MGTFGKVMFERDKVKFGEVNEGGTYLHDNCVGLKAKECECIKRLKKSILHRSLFLWTGNRTKTGE